MKNPEKLSLENITNPEARIAIEFYNTGKLPEGSMIKLKAWTESYGCDNLEELRGLHPDRASIVNGCPEPTLTSVIGRHGGYLIFRESLRNLYIIRNFIISPQAQPSPEAALSGLEREFMVMTDRFMLKSTFPVFVPENWDIKTLKSALLDYSASYRNALGRAPDEESLRVYQALAAPTWFS